MAVKVILDCDTGTDDAISIMLAALHPEVELLAVTTVWGNAEVAVTTQNTLGVLDLIGRSDVPVFGGLPCPLRPPPDGVSARVDPGPGHLPIPKAVTAAAEPPAVEWLVEFLRHTTDAVTLVATGPLTNLAAALTVEPRIVDAVHEVVFMGGSQALGKDDPSADRNVWNDPAAAALTLAAGFERVVLITLDATYGAPLTAEHGRTLHELGTTTGKTAATLLAERIRAYAGRHDLVERNAAPVHDPLTIAYLVDRDVVTLSPAHVAVEAVDALRFGRSVVDLDVAAAGANARVALHADRDRYAELVRSTLAGR